MYFRVGAVRRSYQRDYFKNLNIIFTATKNKDLDNFSKCKTFKHFITKGRKEKRYYNIENNLPKDFDVNNYLSYNSNLDLKNLTDREWQLSDQYTWLTYISEGTGTTDYRQTI